MAQPSSVLSQTMRSISLTKIRELEKQRDRYESRKNEVLAAADNYPGDIRKRITELFRGVANLCETELSQDHKVRNVDLWLQQSKYDATIPTRMLETYEELLRSRLEVQSRKLSIGQLWSRLVTEWMNSSTPMSQTPVTNDESNDDDDRQKERLKDLCEKFEKVVFTPLETDEHKIEQYMQDLFNTNGAKKALETLRSQIRADENDLLELQAPFSRDTLRWCINGLLSEDLVSDEKRGVLRDFLENPGVMDEICDVLNMRYADFDNWGWDAGEHGIPVLPRRQLNGKYRIWMDEDVLQSIFIHYIGIKNCVSLNKVLNSFLESREKAWTWRAGQNMTRDDRMRYEYFSGARLVSHRTVDRTRSNMFKHSFFISQLPNSVEKVGKGGYDDSCTVPEEDDEEEEEGQKDDEKTNIKQKLLRKIATEAITHRTLSGEAAVIQSDLQWYGTGLPHATIFTVMRFLGFSERLVSFYQKVLQAPLNVVSTAGALPTGEPRIRQRGVPMAHSPEKFVGEMILFIMDLAVNKTTGMLLYRLHDDLFLCGEPSRCARAWEEMAKFAGVMGVEFNSNKTGSVYLTGPEKNRDTEIEAALPEGVVRIGHLLLDPASGEWVLDHDQINEHVAQLRKQLAACTSILDWVRTWNSCISRFFSHSLGEPAFCFGLKHVDNVLETYQRIQKALFDTAAQDGDEDQPTTEGNVVSYLRSKIEERFGTSDIPDAFIFLPEKMGGLGVQNPFIQYLAFRKCFLEKESELSPENIMRTYMIKERNEYDEARNELSKLSSKEERLDRLRDLYTSDLQFKNGRRVLEKALDPEGGDDFMSFEEFIRHSESTSHLLNEAYCKLLETPDQKGADLGAVVSKALSQAGIEDMDKSKRMQIEWLTQLYQDELQESWGGFRLVDPKYLPLGLLSMLRGKAVQWNMVL